MMAESDKTNKGGKLGKPFQAAINKVLSPTSVSSRGSDDTQDSLEANVKAEAEAEEGGFLPLEITRNNYSKYKTYKEADEALWNDLIEFDKNSDGSFLEQDFIRYIFIDKATGKACVEVPSVFHERVVIIVRNVINSQCDTNNRVFATASGVMELTTGSEKYPDIFIYGHDRTVETSIGVMPATCLNASIGKSRPMNPNAFIEVSWTNRIRDELEKFALQMEQFRNELGDVSVGYLIKFIPLKRNELPTKHDPDRPVVGFDVYRMTAGGEKPAEGATFCKWRCGEDYPDDLELTADELGHGNGGGVSISLEPIVDGLIGLGVIFQPEN